MSRLLPRSLDASILQAKSFLSAQNFPRIFLEIELTHCTQSSRMFSPRTWITETNEPFTAMFIICSETRTYFSTLTYAGLQVSSCDYDELLVRRLATPAPAKRARRPIHATGTRSASSTSTSRPVPRCHSRACSPASGHRLCCRSPIRRRARHWSTLESRRRGCRG